MNEYEPAHPRQIHPARPASSTESTSAWPTNSGSTAGGLPFPPDPSPDTPTAVTVVEQPLRPRVWRWLSNRRTGRIVAAAAIVPVIGLTVGLASSSSASAARPVSGSAAAGAHGSGGGGSNTRSGPAAGGASGTITSVSKTGFTLTTSAGQKVTVDETSSTKYLKGTSSTSKSTIKKGEEVLVLGTTSSTTIKATQVVIGQMPSAASATAKVIPFQPGTPTTSKQVGQVPASYSQGSGTIVSGTTANKATEAALAAYPGGIVDRVVKLSNGEYEVHFIGVNWPHHVFVDQSFKVVGAG
jgi:hypothetical protein